VLDVPIDQLWKAARVTYTAGKRPHENWEPGLPLGHPTEVIEDFALRSLLLVGLGRFSLL